MRLIAIGTLREFWRIHPDSKEQLQAWYQLLKSAAWKSPNGVKRQFRSASIIGGNRVVFNIAGNKYRLVVKIHYNTGIVYVRFIGTHREYDAVNAEEV
jgi:mRNA interferase HigB